MKKNLKIFGVGAVLPSLSVLLLAVYGRPVLASIVAAISLSAICARYCLNENKLGSVNAIVANLGDTIEEQSTIIRSLRAKYGRLKSDIREMVK